MRSPLKHPGKQVFVGVDYADHVDELPPSWKMTAEPFLKAIASGDGDAAERLSRAHVHRVIGELRGST